MGLLGYWLGEILTLVAGVAIISIYRGYYMPTFKTAEEKEKHLKRIESKSSFFTILGIILLLLGVARIIAKII